MPDYSKGCIYKIKHNDDYSDDNIYIGSTCNLIRRRNKHKMMCNRPDLKEYNRNIYKYIRDNGGWEQFVVLKISAMGWNFVSSPEYCGRELDFKYQIVIIFFNITS